MILRAPQPGDLDSLFAIFADPQTNLFNPAGPYRRREEAETTLNRWLAHWSAHGFGPWALALGHTPDHIVGFGGLAFKTYDKQERVHLGYRFATHVWGRGLASELAGAAIAQGFDTLRQTEIWATVRENHLASRRVLEKAGMIWMDIVADTPGAPANVIYRIQAG